MCSVCINTMEEAQLKYRSFSSDLQKNVYTLGMGKYIVCLPKWQATFVIYFYAQIWKMNLYI